MLSRADLPIKEIMIKGQYDSIDSEQIHLIANKYLIGNFFTINLDWVPFPAPGGPKKINIIKNFKYYWEENL